MLLPHLDWLTANVVFWHQQVKHQKTKADMSQAFHTLWETQTHRLNPFCPSGIFFKEWKLSLNRLLAHHCHQFQTLNVSVKVGSKGWNSPSEDLSLSFSENLIWKPTFPPNWWSLLLSAELLSCLGLLIRFTFYLRSQSINKSINIFLIMLTWIASGTSAQGKTGDCAVSFLIRHKDKLLIYSMTMRAPIFISTLHSK